MTTRPIILGIFAAMAGVTAEAQDAPAAASSQFGAYTFMSVENADIMEGSLDGTFDRLEGNVQITLKTEDPAEKPLPIKADKITFTYAEGNTEMPEKILLEGHVLIDHPTGHMKSDRAEWNTKSSQIVLTGNPLFDTPSMSGVRADSIMIDLDKGTWKILKGKVDNLAFANKGGAGQAAGSAALRETDIPDWAAFFAEFKKQCASDRQTPGKHIVSLFDPESKTAVGSMSVDELQKLRGKFLKKINAALAMPSFYSEAAWANAAVSDEARALLDARTSRTLEPAELARMNRLLLEAAFPKLIASRPADTPAQ